MQKFLNWFDNNFLLYFSGFLLLFIPLYPKLPLMDVLPGYIVRIRLEDFLVSFALFIWIIQLIRRKIHLSKIPLFKPILLYSIVGLLSVFCAILVINTVPLELIHIQKTFLHYFRRLEYFSLFFVFYSSIRNIRQVKVFIWLFVLSVILVAVYGFGQRYYYWPAFSTMNREFAKGWMLYLTEHARVLSTFGGHYDLAAFIMMALIILWSLFFSIQKWYLKFAVFIVIACAFWTLILTASRTSFLAYLAGLTLLFFFWAYKKGMAWAISRWFTVVFLSIVIMLSFGDLSERFTKLLKIDQRVAGIKSLLLSPIGKPPSQKAVFLENNLQSDLSQITSRSDQPPSFARPFDVYQDIPLNIPVGTESGKTVSVARTYSQNAFMYDLSTAIRFDALWPMAIAGFKKNPVLGSGYATLNKTQQTQFTEAESTDNDYLRSLGETGILGFITFFGIFACIFFIIWRNLMIIEDPIIFAFVAGSGGLLFGLLVNAGYIDVFESSKVAFIFWALMGICLASINTYKSKVSNVPIPHIPKLNEYLKNIAGFTVKFLKSDLFKLILLLALAFSLRMYKINEPLADWHSWRQADTSAVTRNFVKHGINVLYPTYDDLSNIASGKDNPKGLRYVEFPIYNAASVVVDKIIAGINIEYSGRMTSILASLGTLVFLFLITRKYLGIYGAIWTGLFYAIIPYNIFYSRVILPEPFLVFTSTGMIYFLDKWSEKSKSYLKGYIYLLLAILFSVSSILLKPFAAFLFLPLLYIFYKKYGLSFKFIGSVILFCAVTMFPFLLWRYWMSNFPEGIPANTWLLNGDGIRFKGAFFYWIFADRLGRLILGFWGLSLFILGLLDKRKNNGIFFFWIAGIILYLFTVATGNVRHDYYQVLTIPIISIFLAKGILLLFDLTKKGYSKIAIFILIPVIVLFMEIFGWYFIRDLYNINHPEIVEAGRAVERKTKDNVLVIAPYNGDTAFLYQTNRAGWPIMQENIDKMIEKGAHYYVSVNFDDLTNLFIKQATIKDPSLRKYKLIEMTDKYVIIQLVPDKLLPQ